MTMPEPLSCGRALESSPPAEFVSPSVYKHPTRGRALEKLAAGRARLPSDDPEVMYR
jgi:hypothetical protein